MKAVPGSQFSAPDESSNTSDAGNAPVSVNFGAGNPEAITAVSPHGMVVAIVA
jgi:hypothetical protein